MQQSAIETREMKITINKWLQYSILLLLTVVAFNSCLDKEGDWDDNIGLLQKTALFQSSADSIIISTQEDGGKPKKLLGYTPDP